MMVYLEVGVVRLNKTALFQLWISPIILPMKRKNGETP